MCSFKPTLSDVLRITYESLVYKKNRSFCRTKLHFLRIDLNWRIAITPNKWSIRDHNELRFIISCHHWICIKTFPGLEKAFFHTKVDIFVWKRATSCWISLVKILDRLYINDFFDCFICAIQKKRGKAAFGFLNIFLFNLYGTQKKYQPIFSR